jgi:transcriptional regulator with XRE-family HTH domain
MSASVAGAPRMLDDAGRTVGQRLREARRLSGYTQQEVANKLGVTRRAVWEWETDKRLPVASLSGLASLYGVPETVLLYDIEPAGQPLEELRAEVSLLHGRLDEVHADLAQLTRLFEEMLGRILTALDNGKP